MGIDLLSGGQITASELEDDFSSEHIQRILNEQAHDYTSFGPVPCSTPATTPPTDELSEQDASGGETKNTSDE